MIGVPDERWGEAVKALVVPRPGARRSTPTSWSRFARDRLAGYKLPRSVEFVDELPRTPDRKGAQARATGSLRWRGSPRANRAHATVARFELKSS